MYMNRQDNIRQDNNKQDVLLKVSMGNQAAPKETTSRASMLLSFGVVVAMAAGLVLVYGYTR